MNKFMFVCCFIACGMGMMSFFASIGCSPKMDPKAKEQPYKHVADFLELSNATCVVTEETASISNAEHTFVFHRNQSTVLVDQTLYYLHHPIVKDTIDTRDLELLRDAIVRPFERKHRLMVMLDAGHGGKDPGCQEETLQEKKIALEVVLEIKRLLEKKGHVVCLTRDGDTYLSLNERCEKAAEKPLDAFVSVHVNASLNATAEGVEVFVVPNKEALSLNGTSLPEGPSISQYFLKTSTRLAFVVQQHLLALNEKPKDRGVRHAYFRVIRDTPAPAILAEIGFITNDKERAQLATPLYRQSIAKAIADGIENALVVNFEAEAATTDSKTQTKGTTK